MGDLFDMLGELVGGAFGALEKGAERLSGWCDEHSYYVTCPYCREDVKVIKYGTYGSKDTGSRNCSNCNREFYIK